jgi:hypothetical protein
MVRSLMTPVTRQSTNTRHTVGFPGEGQNADMESFLNGFDFGQNMALDQSFLTIYDDTTPLSSILDDIMPNRIGE